VNPFRKRTAILIAGVSALLASISGPIAWYVARENAEESIVSLAMEESGRLLHRHHAINLGGGEDAVGRAEAAANIIVGGLFDIAEIYDGNGAKLAESMTSGGRPLSSL